MEVNDFPPTASMLEVRDELVQALDTYVKNWYAVRNEMIATLNKMIDDKSLKTIILKTKK